MFNVLIYRIFFIFLMSFIVINAAENPQDSKTQHPKTRVLDIDSVFLDSRDIEIKDKPLMLIFGKNECYYCDVLSASLVSNDTIQGYINLNFAAYYINIDDKKKHSVKYLNLSRASSLELAKVYELTALPTIIFISSDNKEIMRIVGFPGESRIINLLEFVNNDVWKNYATPKDRVDGFLEYEMDLKKGASK